MTARITTIADVTVGHLASTTATALSVESIGLLARPKWTDGSNQYAETSGLWAENSWRMIADPAALAAALDAINATDDQRSVYAAAQAVTQVVNLTAGDTLVSPVPGTIMIYRHQLSLTVADLAERLGLWRIDSLEGT